MPTQRLRSRLCFGILSCLLFGGCGAHQTSSSYSSEGSVGVELASDSMDLSDIGPILSVALGNTADANGSGGQNVASNAATSRKIIYTCVLDLVVEDYDAFEAELPRLVDQHGGYLSKRETHRRYSDQQSGLWVVRVPVDTYQDLLRGVGGIGFAESREENAQDVTEEYVDVAARVKNKRELENRILQILEDRTGKLADVLAIENELARVREEIERMEGRMKYLRDRTSMATVTIKCRERADYQPAMTPTFVSRIGHSWLGSIEALVTVFQQLIVLFVAALPWLLLLVPIAWMARIALRRSLRAPMATSLSE